MTPIESISPLFIIGVEVVFNKKSNSSEPLNTETLIEELGLE